MNSSSLKKFTSLLESVDLPKYRELYRPIKIVEMDLPKQIQAIALLYEVYWDKRQMISFEDFYKQYLKRYRGAIEEFRQRTTMCKDCFYRGLPARIYRTWASIITQIHGGYVAESVFGSDTVSMSAELDHNGADFQVNYKGIVLNYQVKKKTFSREVRKEKKVSKKISGKFLDILYEVPNDSYFKNPKKKNGEYRLPYMRFRDNPELERLPNGFVVFTKDVFLSIKKKIDSGLSI